MDNQKKIAKRILYVCYAMLPLSLGLLAKIGYDYWQGNAEMHNVAGAVINVALFSALIFQNRRVLKGK
ncbi:MAG: hypothetical protein Q4B58_02790 [Bacteroidales bacterium]|nr:hypothetical protein [Bacteroidales bacterium]